MEQVGVDAIPVAGGTRGVKSGSQNKIVIEPETLYTLSFDAELVNHAGGNVSLGNQRAVVALQNCFSSSRQLSQDVNSPDGSMVINGNNLFLAVSPDDELKSYSGRFYSNNIESCEWLVFGSADGLPNYSSLVPYDFGADYWFDNIALRETGLYYKINNNKLDKTSCNGQVDFDKGCVLFNNRGDVDLPTAARAIAVI